MAKRVAFGGWFFTVALSTVFLVMGGVQSDRLAGIWFGILACFWLTMGATFLINYSTGQRSQQVLGQVEALQLRVQELQRLVEGRRD